MKKIFSVPEISCDHCKNTIENTLSSFDSIQKIDVDISTKSVHIEYEEVLDLDKISTALGEQGYTVVPK
tara:strand:+ start:548 stop:754 length:207 start_codon:yes stop_codon:yes gene_type:complete